jgi:hypothetical protein
MFDFMPHILYNIIYQDSGLDMPCHVIQFLPYTPLLRVPYVRGIIILKHIIVIWAMTCQTKLSLIFVGINITVNNCQSTHTFIGDAAPYHQTYSITTTWIQSRCSPFLVGSSTSKYTVVHSQLYLTFLTINHLLPEIIYSFVSIQFTPCQPFLDIVVANPIVCLTTLL